MANFNDWFDRKKMSKIPSQIHVNIGALIFPFMDQCDFTDRPF